MPEPKYVTARMTATYVIKEDPDAPVLFPDQKKKLAKKLGEKVERHFNDMFMDALGVTRFDVDAKANPEPVALIEQTPKETDQNV